MRSITFRRQFSSFIFDGNFGGMSLSTLLLLSGSNSSQNLKIGCAMYIEDNYRALLVYNLEISEAHVCEISICEMSAIQKLQISSFSR